jgi:uncharacterized membrane protein
MNYNKDNQQSTAILTRAHNALLNLLFIVSYTIILGLSVRIVGALTAWESIPKIRQIYFWILFPIGLAVIALYVYPKYKFATPKGKYIQLMVSLLLLVIVSVVLGGMS